MDNEIINSLLEVKKVSKATDFLISLENKCKLAWRPVGGRENNLATINLGSDPAAGLIERVTNAIDSVLERKWNEIGKPTSARSPREAVEQWLDIPEGKLSSIDEHDIRTDKNGISSLADKVRVTLWDSERKDRPTVDIRDYGIGIKAENFSNTILSLNENLKINKLFLAGAFGQGGSTALSYSHYTIIVSRAFELEKAVTNPVAATIVRFNPGNLETDKHGLYEYAVDRSTGQPFIFDIPEEDFPCGTLVRHVSMDLGKYHNIMTALTGSLWYLAHHYLFDTILPFRIEEQRNNKSQGQIRFVGGNHRRLCQGDNTIYQRNAVLTFRSGSVTISWWVLSTKGKNPKDRITGYCFASKPIIITFNGQKQGELPNTIIKNDLQLPYIERYLVIHVDCDKLDSESRRHLFPTTRESLRDTSLLDELRTLIVETLVADDHLKKLNEERKQQFIYREDNQAVDYIRRRLARRVNSYIRSGGGVGRTPRIPRPNSGGSTVISKPAIPVQEPPTLLEITSPNPREVYPGRNFYIHFRTDVDPAYFMDPESFLVIISPPSIGCYTGTTNVRDGYGTVHFKLNDDAEVGATAEITLEIRPRKQRALSDEINIEVIELPTDSGNEGASALTPNINPIWVDKNHPFWNEKGWDENSVADVSQTDESVEIYVSAENKKLNKLITRAQRRDLKAVDIIKNFYMEHISFYGYMAIANNWDIERQVTPGAVEELRQYELDRACETICGIMEQLFELLVTEASSVVS